ncbi:MAG TPA: hypothetical protein VGK16_00475 [Candidatus Limnocylindrales bacterium]|jgi:hypothetical protein
MTDHGGPSQPRPLPPTPARAPQGRSGGRRRDSRDPPDADLGTVLAPHEVTLIEEAVTTVGRRDRGPVIAVALISAAFLVGLLRPWDLVPRPATVPAAPGSVGVPLTAPSGERTPPIEPTRQLTCAYPSQWRSSTIQDWAGRTARVWTAVEVVEGTGPDDPSIPFAPVVAASVTAIGWCAPIDGPDRPPLALTASLYRIRDGVAQSVPYDRLEPGEPDALGELWLPQLLGVGNRPTWPMGRYVIELRSESGAYRRFLGLELMDHVARPTPSVATLPSAEPSPTGSP